MASSDVPDPAASLDALLVAARGAWPDIAIDDARFVSYLRERMSDAEVGALPAAQAGDLYLACACAQGISSGLTGFRQRFGPALRHAVRRNAPQEQVDDLVQQVWVKLFAEGDPPAIAKYNGRGKLSTWVQTVATRHVLDALRRRAPAGQPTHEDGEILERAIATDDPEIESLKRTYRVAFKEAFQHAFAGLSARQRNLIRHELVDGMNIDQIGALYGVHRATVARWRITCRTELLRETLAYLRREHHVGETEAASVMRLIESQLDVSLTRMLRDGAARDA